FGVAEDLRRGAGEGGEDGDRGPDGGDVSALHLRSESAGVVDRYAVARVCALQACGSHASERGDRGGGGEEQPGIDETDFWRRRGLDAVAASGFRSRVGLGESLPGESGGERGDSRAARFNQLGGRRQGLLRVVA